MGRLYDELTKLDRLYPQNAEQALPPRLANVPDLALAYRELRRLAQSDGDLGADYWNRVIKLVEWAEAAHHNGR
ncbi:hypothetical protein ACJJWD_06380 [Comamonas testosteroni]|uniref:hypothetical protein n=1 Tax=Comamonas testosteroni TaxID=285 RepID=UPI003899DE25